MEAKALGLPVKPAFTGAQIEWALFGFVWRRLPDLGTIGLSTDQVASTFITNGISKRWAFPSGGGGTALNAFIALITD